MKLTKKDKEKMQTRYDMKFREYLEKTKDELKETLEKLGERELKLSSTDTQALWDATSVLMQRDREQKLKELEENNVTQKETSEEPTSKQSESPIEE